MLKIFAKTRIKKGKSENRRLRLKHQVPGILYGKNIKSICIKLNHNKLINVINNKNINEILLLKINNNISLKVKIKSIQKNPYKLKIIHIDFLKI